MSPSSGKLGGGGMPCPLPKEALMEMTQDMWPQQTNSAWVKLWTWPGKSNLSWEEIFKWTYLKKSEIESWVS